MSTGEIGREVSEAAETMARVPTGMLQGSVERLAPDMLGQAIETFLGTVAILQQTVQQAELGGSMVARGAESGNAELFRVLFGADNPNARDAVALGHAMRTATTEQSATLEAMRARLAAIRDVVTTTVEPLRQEYTQLHVELAAKTDVITAAQQEAVKAAYQYVGEITGHAPPPRGG